MKNDIFKEQLVKKEVDSKDRTKRFYIIAIAVAVAVFLNQICMDSATASFSEGNVTMSNAFTLLSVIIFGIGAYIAIKMIRNLKKEFEYSYTSGIYEIDTIFNKSKRKKSFEANVSDFEIMAQIKDKAHLAIYATLPCIDFSSGKVLENTFVFVTTYKGKRCRFIIEPNSEILQAMKTDLTSRRLFLNK